MNYRSAALAALLLTACTGAPGTVSQAPGASPSDGSSSPSEVKPPLVTPITAHVQGVANTSVVPVVDAGQPVRRLPMQLAQKVPIDSIPDGTYAQFWAPAQDGLPGHYSSVSLAASPSATFATYHPRAVDVSKVSFPDSPGVVLLKVFADGIGIAKDPLDSLPHGPSATCSIALSGDYYAVSTWPTPWYLYQQVPKGSPTGFGVYDGTYYPLTLNVKVTDSEGMPVRGLVLKNFQIQVQPPSNGSSNSGTGFDTIAESSPGLYSISGAYIFGEAPGTKRSVSVSVVNYDEPGSITF